RRSERPRADRQPAAGRLTGSSHLRVPRWEDRCDRRQPSLLIVIGSPLRPGARVRAGCYSSLALAFAGPWLAPEGGDVRFETFVPLSRSPDSRLAVKRRRFSSRGIDGGAERREAGFPRRLRAVFPARPS